MDIDVFFLVCPWSFLRRDYPYVEDNRNCEGNFSGKYKFIRKTIKNDLKPFDRLK